MTEKYPYVDEHEFNCENIISHQREEFFALVQKVTAEALSEGIRANSIVINENMVKVPETWIHTPIGARRLPKMVCGLNVYVTTRELPDGYSFAVMEGPDNRLEQFESIGMEPDELRKAAEIYRKIKEAL